jgi:lipid II:glycine glycyltransferase (peptidoglycan interpeptide bridge formation enzyme)
MEATEKYCDNSKIDNLDSGLSCLVDAVDEKQWNAAIPRFRDAAMNQTWSFGSLISGKVGLSHIVLKKNDEILAACQIRLKTLHSRFGIAYAACGPMWRQRQKQDDIEIFRRIVRALRTEYVQRRNLFLIVKPNTYDYEPDAAAIASILKEEGFLHGNSKDRTLMIDLSRSLEELRMGLHQKWRNQLNCAEKNNLQIYQGSDGELFGKFKRIYKEMLARKKYSNAVDIDNFEHIQKQLHDALKFQIVICQSDSELMAAAVFSVVGDTGFYFLGATSSGGMQSKASYLVQWRIIQWLKEHGYRAYDLGGITPETTPETYHFKAGICGKNENNGKDTRRIGKFTACKRSVNSFIVKNALLIRDFTNQLKCRIC